METVTVNVTERFRLAEATVLELHHLTPNFGFNGLGMLVYYRTYSRVKADGKQETWAETVIRVTEGIFSIRKNHMKVQGLHWNEAERQAYAHGFALSMFRMEFLPPGRGLWACGTDFMYERGSAALNNCGATSTADLVLAVAWAMDALMCGIGVGFDTRWKPARDYQAQPIDKTVKVAFLIPDSREGWVKSVEMLVDFYVNDAGKQPFPIFDYSAIRPAGLPIKGFGGTSSGSACLVKLHHRIEAFFDCYVRCSCTAHADDNAQVKAMIDQLGGVGVFDNPADLKARTQTDTYDEVRLVADIMNSIGATVIAGSVRRSAMIALGENRGSFRDLKNYDKCPERADIGWMSNNTVVLWETEDFKQLPEIAQHIRKNGEPGFLNHLNVKRYGRVNHRSPENRSDWTREQEPDKATLTNPCSEIPLEDKELCCLSEVFPTRCTFPATGQFDRAAFLKATEYATFYASSVNLLPTHWVATNQVVARNRRIGVSLSGLADFLNMINETDFTDLMGDAYRNVRAVNTRLAAEAGIPASIRVTTVKPSGSISLLTGVSPGLHYPTHSYCIRRVRVGEHTPIAKFLVKAGMPYEKDVYSDNTFVFSFPIDQSGTRPATEVSMWQQSFRLIYMQGRWADNSVSVTIYFNPKTEAKDLEGLLAEV